MVPLQFFLTVVEETSVLVMTPVTQHHAETNRAGSSSSEEGQDQEAGKKKPWRKYYEANKALLRAKARERAARDELAIFLIRAKQHRLESETPEETQERLSRHREAAAKYREANRIKIRVKAWERYWYQREWEDTHNLKRDPVLRPALF
ncbi:hypothetical protein CVT26_006561 [Gymnopilus dilepis]|uniref:Uncharacterized protein n=1 Tax=Gymnopilus dilepis TaxID=231916 RepID=A0A409W5Y9_9AGAR|nr:hypothetical protein CVT26_006561 [Gymnopilus dilepis]